VLNAANIVLSLQFIVTVALLVFLVKRKAHRLFPLFFCYVAYAIAETSVQWATYSNPRLYFKVYWITEAIDIILAVAATCESFISTFRGFFALRWFRFVLPMLAIIVAIYATWKAWVHPPVLNSPLAALVIGLEIALRYYIAGIFLIYVASRAMWKVSNFRFQYNIVLGYFLASAGMLVAALLRSEFGTKYRLTISWAQPVGYSFALLVWFLSSLTPLTVEKEPAIARTQADSAMNELEKYSSVLRKVGK
jgi:hypothetical protein